MSTLPDRILVVDDLPDNLALIEAILSSEGYLVEIASSGKAALEQVRQEPPHLILLDVMMPEMDGIETTRRLKSYADLPFIPILLLTASTRGNVVEGLDAGADEFIRKPIDQDELLARVRALLRLKHSVDERDLIACQREDFVSRLTHDLRTPLVAADRMSTLILQEELGKVEPSLQEALTTLQHSNQHLLTMTNSLLEVYRYEAGKKTLHYEDIDGESLFQDIQREFSPLAQVKNIQFTVNIAPKNSIYADRIELRRIIQNLLGNALKFTDLEGKITLESLDIDGGIEFSVTDTGCGIASEEQPYLFNRFTQGKHFRGGTGLGLHHAKQIVEAHGGRISLQSTLGEGSIFTVFLPAAKLP